MSQAGSQPAFLSGGASIKVAAILVGALATVITVIVAVLAPSYFSDEAERSTMLSVADQLLPGSGWTQVQDRVVGSFLCTPGEAGWNLIGSYYLRLVIVRESDTKPVFLELGMEKINS